MINKVTREEIAAIDKWVLEVRDGIVLFFNRWADPHERDGWWWGTDALPTLFGPFKSKEAAVNDACDVSDEPMRVVLRDDTEMRMSDDEMQPLHVDGTVTINVIDTEGDVWRSRQRPGPHSLSSDSAFRHEDDA